MLYSNAMRPTQHADPVIIRRLIQYDEDEALVDYKRQQYLYQIQVKYNSILLYRER